MHTDLLHRKPTDLPATIDAVFATPRHCLSTAPGGQQQYTRELLETLNEAGVRTHAIPLPYARSLPTRVIQKLVNRPYRQDFSQAAVNEIAEATAATNSACVFLNGITFFGVANALRRAMPGKRLIMLSHGLESTDYVHVLAAKGIDGDPSKPKRREILKLGRQLIEERQSLGAFDGTVGLTPVDAEINRWLGANHSFWLPRAVTPCPIDWNPVKHRVGFVGTLDHPPNFEGLLRVLRVIADKKLNLRVRVVGGPESRGQEIQSHFQCVEYLGPLEENELTREATSWRAFLHPVFSFARGASTKLATGFGWGIPIVTSTAGRRGYVWESGRLTEANSPEQFVDEALELATNDSYVHEARQQILEIARSSPTIHSNAKQFREYLDSVLR